MYFEPTTRHPIGGFACQHSHGPELTVRHLLQAVDVDPAAARHKPRIRIIQGEISAIVDAELRVLAGLGTHFKAGNVIVSLQTDPVTGDVVTVPADEADLTRLLADAADWEKWDEGRKRWTRCDPPPKHIHLLHRASDHDHLPVLSGIARQPYFRENDGELVVMPGYDPLSKRFGAFDPLAFPLPEPTLEAAVAAKGRLLAPLEEFHFASEEDRSAALSAMITAAVRPALPVAPAFNVTAPNPGSGKSYLCSIIVAFAGPGDSMKVSYPVKTEEATKVILSLLLQQPAVIEFDDMTGDWLAHGAINRMITNPTISDRLLGVSKAVTVSTRSLVIGSGNNIEPARDMRRRVVTIRLDPPVDFRQFQGRPAALIRANRGAYVADALTIVRAHKAAGSPRTDVPNVAGFEAWADHARHPLIWLGMADPAAPLLEQVRHDPERDFLGALIVEWEKKFGDRPTTVRTAVSYAELPAGADLLDVLGELHLVQRGEIDRNRFGHYLRKNAGRRANGLRFERAEGSERLAWRVVSVGDRDRPLD